CMGQDEELSVKPPRSPIVGRDSKRMPLIASHNVAYIRDLSRKTIDALHSGIDFLEKRYAARHVATIPCGHVKRAYLGLEVIGQPYDLTLQQIRLETHKDLQCLRQPYGALGRCEDSLTFKLRHYPMVTRLRGMMGKGV